MNNMNKRAQSDNRQALLNGTTRCNARRLLHILTAVIVMAITACDDYNHSISDIEDRVDHIEGTTLTTVDQQVTNINVSIENLEALDEALLQLIDDLQVKATDLQSQLDNNLAADTVNVQTIENEIANIKTLIAELQKKDTELEKKITDLRAYVDGEISATENWANATFATLAQYADMQSEIANLKQLLKQHRDEITAAYTKKVEEAILTSEESMKAWVNKHLTEGYYDIAAIDAKLASLETKLENADATLQKEIEDQQAALEQAKEELTAAYQKAIADAIETNNGKINSAIADAIKDVQDKVDTRLAVIDNAIAAIRKDIEDIKSSIASIQEQIASINSSIGELQEVDTQLGAYIDALETTAANLQTQLDATNTKIDQVKADLQGEISAAKQALIAELNSLKKAIESKLAAIQSDITALKAKDTELEKKISTLKTYVDEELATLETLFNSGIDANKTWANATFATLTQYEAVQTAIAGIKADILTIQTSITELKTYVDKKIATDIQTAIEALRAELSADYVQKIADAVTGVTTAYTEAIATAKKDITQSYTQAIADAITACEDGMKQWVSKTLADSYYDIAEVDAALEALLKEAKAHSDQELIDAVKAQQEALEKAKTDLTTAHTTAITEVIKDGGTIDTKITGAKTELQEKIDEINNQITAIIGRIETLEGKVESLETLLSTLQGSLNQLEGICATDEELENAIEQLTGSINAITERVNNLDDTYATDAELQKAISDLQNELTALITAITQTGGTIDTRIKEAIDNLTNNTINSIITRIDTLEGKVENLENRIQSLRFLPEYNDGMVKLSKTTLNATTLTFLISPNALAKSVADAHNATEAPKKIHVYLSETTTRAASVFQELNVTSVKGNETSGMLEIVIEKDDNWASNINGNIFIRINDGNNDIISEMIPFIYINE